MRAWIRSQDKDFPLTKEVEDGTTKGEGIAIQQLYFNYTVELRTKEVEDDRTTTKRR